MTEQVKKINSIADFVRVLATTQKKHKGALWYRGQSDSSWPLLPGFSRLSDPPTEISIFNEFRQSAALLAEFTPKGSFDWLMLMQHYGVPTRLLDWSESPMVALYFALSGRENHKGKDAAFWVLNPVTLNEKARLNDKRDPSYVPSFEDEALETYTIDYLRNGPVVELLPVAAVAIRNNSRIQAQSGVFTIHHSKKDPIEKVGDGKHVVKYVIPNSKKELLASQLEVLGLNAFHVFPELATIGDLIKDRCK